MFHVVTSSAVMLLHQRILTVELIDEFAWEELVLEELDGCTQRAFFILFNSAASY